MKNLPKEDVDKAVAGAFRSSPLGMVDAASLPDVELSDKSSVQAFNGEMTISPAGSQ